MTGLGHSTVEPPREGLPPCIRGLVVFGDQQACWHDMELCPKPDADWPSEDQHVITVGRRGSERETNDCTDGAVRLVYWIGLWPFLTGEETAAEQAWEQAVVRLRTGDGSG